MTIETQEQLDGLLQSPEALNEFIEDKARAMAEKVVGDRVLQVPEAAYVEQVYRGGNFGVLGIS